MRHSIVLKLVLLLMLASLLVAPLGALADDNVNPTGMPIVKTPIEMTMMIRVDTSRGIDPSQNAVFLYLEELTGIHWNFNIVDSAAWTEKLNLLWASNDLPDMIYLGVPMADIKTYTGRQIMDIAGLLPAYAPNFSALMEKSKDVRMATVQPDGKVGTFVWTNMDVETGSGQCPFDILYINQDWLTKLNLPMPTTVGEYIDTLKAFRDGDPNGNGLKDEIPLAPRYAWESLQYLQPLCGFMSSSPYSLFLDGETVRFTPFMDEYKEYVKMCAQMYGEKLLDPDIFVMKTADVTAKGSTETQIYGSLVGSAAFTEVGENNATAFVPTPVFTAANGQQMWYTRQFANPGVGIITSACKYPEAAVRWCDLFFDKEYEKLVWMGQEGVAYEFADASRTTWNWIFTDDAKTSTDVRAKRTIQAGGQGPSICPVEWFDLNDKVEAPVNAQRKQIGTDYFGKLRLPMPVMYYDTAEQRQINTVWTDLKSYIEQQFALFVTGQQDIDAGWDTFVQTLKNMGAEQLVTTAQKTYDSAK